MGNRLNQFMQGRYGVDQLNRLIVGVALVMLILSIFLGNFFTVVSLILLGFFYYRAMSRKIATRYAENQFYLRQRNQFRGLLWQKKQRAQEHKTHKFYKCPDCSQKVRVPKGMGKIAIHCPKCGKEFVKKT